eukprot:1096081-Pyramimonas_sp.AAC.1
MNARSGTLRLQPPWRRNYDSAWAARINAAAHVREGVAGTSWERPPTPIRQANTQSRQGKRRNLNALRGTP